MYIVSLSPTPFLPVQSLPHSVRGVVLGFAARVLGSVERREQDRVVRSLAGALCVGFDSESLGFAGALARVFTRVSAWWSGEW